MNRVNRQPMRRVPFALLACCIPATGELAADRRTAEAMEPARVPQVEIIEGVVLTDGIPEGFTLIEGDILVPEDFLAMPAAYATNLWPGGIVPFSFDPNVSPANQATVLSAMAPWEAAATVDFRARSDEDDFVLIRDSSDDAVPGNSSALGYQGGLQVINITDWTVGGATFIIAHELGHTLGYWHEQSRTDRDSFVQINLENIQAGYEGQFAIRPDSGGEYGPYDFGSVMHYGQCAFSCCAADVDPCLALVCSFRPSDCRTITVLPPYDAQWQTGIGQRNQLSFWDKRVMSFLYPQGDWRFVDQSWDGDESGTFFEPWASLSAALDDLPDGGTLWFLAGDHYSAVGMHTRPMVLNAGYQPVMLGN